MNRIIKFRAWNPTARCMYENVMIFEDKMVIASHQIFHGKDGDPFIEPTIYQIESSLHKWPVMQFTGLHDKDGKEIYEGDILIWNKNTKCVVVFENGSFGGRFNGHDKNNSWINLSVLKVIGNVFENPELMTND